MSLDQNDRAIEWSLMLGDWIRETSKSWYYFLAIVLVTALPLKMVLNLVFEGILISSIKPIRITYEEVAKQPLAVTEKKIFDLGDGTYSGYVKVKNSNPDWGVPEQGYSVAFRTAGGSTVNPFTSATFILPDSEKVIVIRRFSSDKKPTDIDFQLKESSFVRPPSVQPLDLETERKSASFGNKETVINAVIYNRTPFRISRVDLPVLLFDSNNQIVGVNYTNINDLNSSETRSFQYIWYNRINNVARSEIIPQVNIFNREVFGSEAGQDSFENIE